MSGGRAQWVSWAIAGVLIAALAGCSGDDPEPEPVESRAPAPEVTNTPAPDEGPLAAQVAWSADGYLMTAGVYNDVLVAVAEGEPEMLRGLDVATGEVLWETPTSRGMVTASVLVMPTPIETSTGEILVFNAMPPVYDEATDFSYHPLQLLNPATGEVVKDYGNLGVSNLWTCAIEGSACMWILKPEVLDQDFQVRINPETLELDDWNDVTAEGYDHLRWYGDIVHAVEVGGEQYMVGLDADGEKWRTPTAQLLGEGAVATGDALVAAHVDEDTNVLLLTGNFDPAQGGAQTADVATFVTAGIDVDTGEALWTHEGLTVCGFGVFCSGDVTFQRAADDEGGTYDVRTGVVELSGFDYRTGQLTWTNAPVAVEGVSLGGTTTGFVATEEVMYLTLDGETHSINIDTGEVTPLGDGYAACYQPIVEDRHAWSNPASELVPTWVGFEYHLCNDSGPAPAEAEFTQEMVESAETVTWRPEAQQAQDLPTPRFRVINTPQGLLAFEF